MKKSKGKKIPRSLKKKLAMQYDKDMVRRKLNYCEFKKKTSQILNIFPEHYPEFEKWVLEQKITYDDHLKGKEEEKIKKICKKANRKLAELLGKHEIIVHTLPKGTNFIGDNWESEAEEIIKVWIPNIFACKVGEFLYAIKLLYGMPEHKWYKKSPEKVKKYYEDQKKYLQMLKERGFKI
jgi:hypothetical protein